MKYFENCTCIEEVKETYRKLCFRYHSDVSKEPNASETMKIINSQYDIAFDKYKNIFKSSKGEVYTDQKTVSETPEEFKNIMSMLVNMQGVRIELIGRWIWLTGNTKQYKDDLKKFGFKWCRLKKAWSWKRIEDQVISKKKRSLDDIRSVYGSTEIRKDLKPKFLSSANKKAITMKQHDDSNATQTI